MDHALPDSSLAVDFYFNEIAAEAGKSSDPILSMATCNSSDATQIWSLDEVNGMGVIVSPLVRNDMTCFTVCLCFSSRKVI